jgi:glycosyltransferase involved in cell wall biosynthesis
VAHPAGELRRRASQGLDLIALAPRNEVDLRAAWYLSRIIRDLGPEVVHAHDPHAVAMGAQALAFVSHLSRAPLVASRRVDFHLKKSSLSRWKYRQVDLFICASDAIRSVLVSDGIPELRTVTVHEGIDVDRVASLAAGSVHAEFYLPRHAPVVGNTAALVPHKGHRHLIDAAALVVRQVPDARFVILGEGELRPALERQIHELHLEKHMTLGGFRPDALSLVKSFDVFVMSSVTEGLGTSLLDAMACARPIVATEAGGIPEVVIHGETGLLVPPRDHEAMADAIVLLLRHDALRARFGEAGLVRVRAKFTADRMVRETLSLYERVAGMRREAGTAHHLARD